jgi:hypothetical protein
MRIAAIALGAAFALAGCYDSGTKEESTTQEALEDARGDSAAPPGAMTRGAQDTATGGIARDSITLHDSVRAQVPTGRP